MGYQLLTRKNIKTKSLRQAQTWPWIKLLLFWFKEFENIKSAQEYINTYKAGYEILDDYQDNKIYSIGKKQSSKNSN